MITISKDDLIFKFKEQIFSSVIPPTLNSMLTVLKKPTDLKDIETIVTMMKKYLNDNEIERI